MTEIRIAAVMNGGISLAVWMGGVTHELDRVRLASAGWAPDDARERAVHDAWTAVLTAAGKTVVVDTIAGTSAGGLNGTLLATAIAHGGDLRSLREVWLHRASLAPGKLLRTKAEGAPTLLDGGYFTRQINEALATVAATDPAVSAARGREVTLLVTATAIGAPTPPVRLEDGREDSYRDSRRVYRFRRRHHPDGTVDVLDLEAPAVRPSPGEWTGEVPSEPSGPLARAARASASFPVAFEPVLEDAALTCQRISPPRRGDEQPIALMDGGVLDNAPFGPVLDTLRQRPVGAPFERVLLYVVPSVSARQSPVSLGPDDLPDVGRVLGAAFSSLGEPDQRLDVEALQESFRQMSFQQTTPHAVLARALEGGEGGLADAAGALLDVYRRGRAEAFHRWLVGLGEPVDLRRPAWIEPDPDDIPVVPSPGEAEPWAARPWHWGATTAERVLRWLGRALVRISTAPGQHKAEAGAAAPTLEAAFAALSAAQRRVRDLVEAQAATLADPSFLALEGYAARLAAFTERVATDDQRAQLGAAVESAADAVAAWFASTSDAPDALGASGVLVTGADVVASALHVEVISSALSWGGDAGDTPRFTYRQLSPAAPPLPGLPGSPGPDLPDDPDTWAATKLYGERWAHFGAFATPRGREHDWLWGRLDAAASLLQMLLGPEYADSPLTTRLVDAILDAEQTDRDAVIKGARTVSALDARRLYALMMAQPDGEERRELLLTTVPEVVGRVDALPPGAEQVVRVLADQAEELADVLDVVRAAKARLRRLLGRNDDGSR